MRLRAAVLGLFLAVMLPAAPVLAIQGIGISPTSQELEIAPGEVHKGEITVINDGDTDITYKIYATDYKVQGENYKGDFTATGAGSQNSPVSWFGLPAGGFVVKARQETKFPYTLIVPKNAAVGGHYGAVFVQTVPPASAGAAIINRVDRVGSIFYLGVGGNLDKRGTVLPLAVPWLQALSPITGALRIRGEGNSHFQAEITEQLANPFGDVGKPGQIRGEVLPGTTRRFDLSLPASSPIGLYKLTAKVKYLDKSEQQSRWVLLLPRMTFLVVAGTLLLLLALAFVGLWRRLRRKPPTS